MSRPARGLGIRPVEVEQVGAGGLEELFGGPAGEHFLQDAAVVGVGQAAQGAGEPAVQLGAAGDASGQVRVDPGGSLVVFGAERAVVLPVAFPEQELEQEGPFGHVISTSRIVCVLA